MAKKAPKKKIKKTIEISRVKEFKLQSDTPVTVKSLEAFRSEVVGLFMQVDKKFKQIDLRFEQIDLRFEQVDRRFEELEAKIEALDVKFTAKFDRIITLIEQQRAENQIAFEGMRNLFERQDRLEKKFDALI